MHRPRIGTTRVVRDRPVAFERFDWSETPVEPAIPIVEPELTSLTREPASVPSVDTLAAERRISELEREMEAREQAAYRRGQDEVNALIKKQTDEALRILRTSIEDLNSRKSKILEEAEVSLVHLALAIARRVIHRELTISQEALHGLVKVALDRIRSQELLRILVHPNHEVQVRKAVAAVSNSGSIEIVASDNLPLGGLQFETRHGYMDVSVDTQLSEIERGLTDHLESLR